MTTNAFGRPHGSTERELVTGTLGMFMPLPMDTAAGVRVQAALQPLEGLVTDSRPHVIPPVSTTGHASPTGQAGGGGDGGGAQEQMRAWCVPPKLVPDGGWFISQLKSDV